ncbi:MAG TPA: hypothetical protein VJ770_19230 [Stellaceae bacterium]|nr:hypothetical protein [Stellaceae bacterium]
MPDPDALIIKPIGEDPAYAALLAEMVALEKRLAESDARRQRAIARRRGAKPARGAIEMARDLVRGGAVAGIDPDAEIEACDRERYEILGPAIRELASRIEDLRGDLSLAECRRLREHYAAALRQSLQAIEDLLATLQVATGIRARLMAAGYQPLSGVLPDACPPAVIALSENAPFGVAWFRRRLEENGIV